MRPIIAKQFPGCWQGGSPQDSAERRAPACAASAARAVPFPPRPANRIGQVLPAHPPRRRGFDAMRHGRLRSTQRCVNGSACVVRGFVTPATGVAAILRRPGQSKGRQSQLFAGSRLSHALYWQGLRRCRCGKSLPRHLQVPAQLGQTARAEVAARCRIAVEKRHGVQHPSHTGGTQGFFALAMNLSQNHIGASRAAGGGNARHPAQFRQSIRTIGHCCQCRALNDTKMTVHTVIDRCQLQCYSKLIIGICQLRRRQC